MIGPNQQKSSTQNLSAWLLAATYALLVVAGFSVPVVVTLNISSAPPSAILEAVVATAGMLTVVLALHALGRSWRGLFWLYPLLVCFFVVRLTHYGAVDFSGSGFTDEFFLHIEAESIRLAVKEYDRALAIGGLILLLILSGTYGFSKQQLLFSPRPVLIMCLAGAVCAVAWRTSLPEWQLYQAWKDWRDPLAMLDSRDQQTTNKLIDLGLLEIDFPYKQQVNAQVSQKPKNLIVLYLESVGVNLATQPSWPELMPNFKRLLSEHAWVDHLWTSSYITIEGLTNTQCGTLVPFDRGSESIADGDGLADSLPCLGDVLDTAGYHQVFLGGAETTFAGKGTFLSAHGFDEVYGLEHWRAQGLNARPNTWGLSDPDLFNQSLQKINELQEGSTPWHLSLLTIGTHLPGYLYEECARYAHGDAEFLQALHCTDQLLGQWVEALEGKGIFEDTVLVITADHQVFPNAAMRALFGDGVYDRRLPMIVLGPVDVSPAMASGAGYDFAPTVLDLLDIEHDARFVLGRSLTSAFDRPEYFVTRYSDFFNGDRAENPADCSPLSGAPLPLNQCEKEELLSILTLIAERYSKRPAKLSCGLDYIQYRPMDEGVLEIILGGEDQANRFIRSGRPVDLNRSGWALVGLDARGEVLSRVFIPGDTNAEGLSDLIDEHATTASSQILVWTGEGLPADLFGLSAPDLPGPHAWWVSASQQVIAASIPASDSQGREIKTLSFDHDTCKRAADLGALLPD